MKGTLLGLALVLSTSAMAQKTDSVAEDTKTPYGQFQVEMRRLDIGTNAVTCATDDRGRVSFTVRCADEAERVRVRDALVKLNGGVNSTKEPPTVSGVLAKAARNDSVAETAEDRDTAKNVFGGGASTGPTSKAGSSGYRSSSASKSPDSSKDVHVSGYTTKKGKYVHSYDRRSPGSK